MKLIDRYGRRIKKLRVSIMDLCNLRCFYCMPEKMQFMPKSQWLSSREIQNICQSLKGLGLEELRITGGEPTLRSDFIDIVEKLSELKFKKMGLTTNGVVLSRFLPALQNTSVSSINISLDSLDPENFFRITRRKEFYSVLDSIYMARDLGFQVKINCVVMKGVNDNEILDFVKFSAKEQIEVRFLELMKIGQACRLPLSDAFLPADSMIDTILSKYSLTKENVPLDATAFVYRISNGARIGFIASESKPFCGHCSRWRLSANGMLRACLMKEDGVNVRHKDTGELEQCLHQLLDLKPIERAKSIKQDMYQIGG